jgi:hypothetical protein
VICKNPGMAKKSFPAAIVNFVNGAVMSGAEFAVMG